MAPENTLPSFELALEAGADLVELPRRLGQNQIASTPAVAIATVGQLGWKSTAKVRSLPIKSGGRVCLSPKKSRIWVLRIMIAMPLVKPVTTGKGIYLIRVPSLAAPSATRITPAIRVHATSP